MLNLTHNDKPDALEYMNNVSVDKRVFFDIDAVRRAMDFEEALAETCEGITGEVFEEQNQEGCLNNNILYNIGSTDRSKDAIIEYLKKEVGENKYYMLQVYDKRKKTSRFSLDKSNVLVPLLDNGYAKMFLTEYLIYRDHLKAYSSMRTKVSSYFEKTAIDGIESLGYNWTRSITGRLYTKDDNIQNIKKLYLDSMRSENDDYVLVWGDLDQIDLRIAYYTLLSESDEDNKIFKEYDDKYEAIARIIDNKLCRQFNKEYFKENRKKYKTAILAKCYGQTSVSTMATINDKDFVDTLENYLSSNKRYSSWKDKVWSVSEKESVDVYTYFGEHLRINLTDCKTRDQRIDRLLNAPIQSTTNNVVMHIVNQTVRKAREMGIDRDKFRVYMIRHDEPIYMLHKSALSFLKVIKNYTAVQIDDWEPITMSLNVGTYYTKSENDYYGDFFDGVDVMNDRQIVPDKSFYYEPLKVPSGQSKGNVKFNIDLPMIYIDDNAYEIDENMHIKFQIHNIILKYMIEHGLYSITLNMSDNSLKMRDISLYGKNVYINVAS